jgi:ABC-type multidrug transport system ATPase subunit
MCGFLRPTSGALTIGGIAHDSPQALGMIGALPQDAQFNPSEPVGEQLAFLAQLQGFKAGDAKRESKRVLKLVKLETHYNARPGALSHGMLKRVSIAQALIGRPPIIILDEPTAGLDPETARHLRNLLSELTQTTTLLVSSHNLEELENLCHRTLFLEQGTLTEISHNESADTQFLTIEVEPSAQDGLAELIRALDDVISVEPKGRTTFIITYSSQGEQTLDLRVIELLRRNNWTYRSLLRGKTLEDQLFGDAIIQKHKYDGKV